MNPKIDIEQVLRALARTQSGPFRAVAYGVTKDPGNRERLEGELLELAMKEASDPRPAVLVDVGDPFQAAAQRPLFRRDLLGGLLAPKRSRSKDKQGPEPFTGRGAPARARERLAEVAASLPKILGEVDRVLSGVDPGRARAAEDDRAVPATPISPEDPVPDGEGNPQEEEPSPAHDERIPLLIVRKLEDLGSDPEAVAGAIARVIAGGAHVVVHEDGLDTRTREGRAIARNTLRLGALKAERSRERALADLERRRQWLQVYGPVPFGFTKDGQELRPVQEQLEAVRRIRELAHLSQTHVTIAVTLNREKRFWKDGSRWTWRRVAQVRKNPIYNQVLAETER